MAYIRHCFGEVEGFPQISRLLQVFFPGTPVDVALGGHVQAEIACGNHPSPESHTGAIRAEIAQDLVNGLALMFKRLSISDIGSLRVSPLDTVLGKKLPIIHDLTFARDGHCSSVIDDNDFSAAPPCEFVPVFVDVRTLYLRQRHVLVARVML